MRNEIIARIGRAAYTRSVTPWKRPLKELETEIVGFDTEYESGSGRLISYQLWGTGGGRFIKARRIDIERLAHQCLGVVARPVKVIRLVVYFSIADLRFFPPLGQAIRIREYARGSLDVLYPTNPRLDVFDLARFFDGQSLAKAAEGFGLKKLSWPRDQITRQDTSKPEFVEYALNDAKLCYQISTCLYNEFLAKGANIFEMRTSAALSARVYRSQYVTRKLCCDQTRVRLLAVKATWGGRSEAFVRGRFARVNEYDLSSAYPKAAVSLAQFPVQKSWRAIESLKSCEARGGIVAATFRFPDSVAYPCLPVFFRSHLLFPQSGVSYATLDEYRLALAFGCDVRLHEAYVYDHGDSSLATYLTDLLAARENAIGAKKVAIKLLANSLIGKFSQHRERWNFDEIQAKCVEIGMPFEDFWRLTEYERRALGLTTHTNLGAVWAPEWSALIMGRVRATLGGFLARVSPLYCATDSVWTQASLDAPEWMLKSSGEAVILRTKLCGLFGQDSEHVVHHGIWTRQAACDMLRAWPQSGPLAYSVRRPLKMRESCMRGKKVGTWVAEARHASLEWCGKRRLVKDGSTRPWRDVEEFAMDLQERELKNEAQASC